MSALLAPLAIALAVVLALAYLLWRGAQGGQAPDGHARREVVYQDTADREASRPLYAARYGLAGKPDYILRRREGLIPVEVKPGRRAHSPFQADVMQLAAYCLLVEESSGQAPPYGLLPTRSTPSRSATPPNCAARCWPRWRPCAATARPTRCAAATTTPSAAGTAASRPTATRAWRTERETRFSPVQSIQNPTIFVTLRPLLCLTYRVWTARRKDARITHEAGLRSGEQLHLPDLGRPTCAIVFKLMEGLTMIMRVLLVYPSFPHLLELRARPTLHPPQGSFPPLGLLTFALLPQEWERRLVDMNVAPLTRHDLEWAD
jgi:hypothetical protein